MDIVLLAASQGGIHALRTVLSGLPSSFPAPVVIVQHRSPKYPSMLAKVLQRSTNLNIVDAVEGEPLVPGTVYIAPADRHLTVASGRRIALTDGYRIRHVLSSADPLFGSAALAYGAGVVGVVLTGNASDGSDGARMVKKAGGFIIAQDEATSETFGMPKSAIGTGCVDRVLPLEEIAPALLGLVGSQPKAV